MPRKRYLLSGMLCLLFALAFLPTRAQDQPNESGYTPDQIRSISTEIFLKRMLYPEPNCDTFAAMNALIQKAKESTGPARDQILSQVIKAMQDKRNPAEQRWQCCYVLSGSGDKRVIPYLIPVLLRGESDTLRSVAADALAAFPRNAAAHKALLEAARQETSPEVRLTFSRLLGKELPELAPSAAVRQGNEWAPSGPPQPPSGPAPPVASPLPWPFPGGQEDQNIFNNYQQATDGYIHAGLDFIHDAGTPVTAVDSGYVRAIFTNYPEWITHYCFFVSSQKGGNEGWCYTHIDPRTFPFKVGEFVRRGDRLGSLVDFSVGNQPGVAHLHLQYARLVRNNLGKPDAHSLLDPLYFFAWKDTQPPVFQPLRFVKEGTLQQFQADASGLVTVSGRVDLLAAVTDGGFPGHMGNLGVPVVMLSISDGKHTLQKLVVDHRGDIGDVTQVKPLYLSYEESKTFCDPDAFPRYQILRVTKTDGDGRITPRDAAQCWDTATRDDTGKPLWPNGRYSVNVYVWDIAGNRAVAGAIVKVKNN
jgi:murein DD-endopeptidase MepM/ murein hydrolase activator NlpD